MGIVGFGGDGVGVGGYLNNARTNIRNFIVSPQGVQWANTLNTWGRSLRWAGDVVTVGGVGLEVVGVITLQPELVAAGLAGEQVGVGMNLAGNVLSGAAAGMQSIQQNSYNPIIQYTLTGYTGQYMPPNPNPNSQ